MTFLTSTIATRFLTEPQLTSLHAYPRFAPNQFSDLDVDCNLSSRVNVACIWDEGTANALDGTVKSILKETEGAYGVLQFNLEHLNRARALNSPLDPDAYKRTRTLLARLAENHSGRIAIVYDNKGRNVVTGLYMDACDTGRLDLNDSSYITRHYGWDRLMDALEPLQFPKKKEP